MNWPILIRTEAASDIADAMRWYHSRRAGLGAAFQLAVDASLESVSRNPTAFPIVYGDIRRALLRRFPYGILYLIEEDCVVVLGVLHCSRDPGTGAAREKGTAED